MKLVVTNYGLGEMSGGFGETCSNQLYTWRMSGEFGETGYKQL